MSTEKTISHLLERAQVALVRFQRDRSKPVIIEFAGSPKAGKTSTISQIQSFFKRCGFRVEVVVERASVCPVRDKKNFNFNVWTACTTLAQILEKTQDPPRIDDPQILILDRGLFDAISWLMMMDRVSRMRTEDRVAVEKFLTISDWRKRITGVILMTASPEDAMGRERGHLPVQTTGSIMNPEILKKNLETALECQDRLKNQFRIFRVDTSSGEMKNKPQRTCEIVADIILNLIDEQLREEVLHLKKDKVIEHFESKTALLGEKSLSLLNAFQKGGTFEPRDVVEANSDLVQALPVAVVRNQSGAVLLLRRRERSEENKLHEQLVIWAGGHVRKEDSHNGDAIKQCLLRELQEELRLSVEIEELHYLGAVYSDSGGSTSKHVALVFEWRAETDDVAVTLSTAEFFERKGTALSGKFVTLDELAKEIIAKKVQEVWTTEIVKGLLQAPALKDRPTLFG